VCVWKGGWGSVTICVYTHACIGIHCDDRVREREYVFVCSCVSEKENAQKSERAREKKSEIAGEQQGETKIGRARAKERETQVAKPSLSQRSVHQVMVTKLPNHWCASSCATTYATRCFET